MNIHKDSSLILANITERDNERFHAHAVPWSGSTGMAPRPNDPLAPYIATTLEELPGALKAMDWKHLSVSFAGDQWIVRHFKESVDDRLERIEALLNI